MMEDSVTSGFDFENFIIGHECNDTAHKVSSLDKLHCEFRADLTNTSDRNVFFNMLRHF